MKISRGRDPKSILKESGKREASPPLRLKNFESGMPQSRD
jgi:hypothetical protein